jgi:hypothetical protein
MIYSHRGLLGKAFYDLLSRVLLIYGIVHFSRSRSALVYTHSDYFLFDDTGDRSSIELDSSGIDFHNILRCGADTKNWLFSLVVIARLPQNN